MRHSVALPLVVAALLLVFASSTPVAFAQSGDRVIVPESSIQRPEDVGVRAHTNYRYGSAREGHNRQQRRSHRGEPVISGLHL